MYRSLIIDSKTSVKSPVIPIVVSAHRNETSEWLKFAPNLHVGIFDTHRGFMRKEIMDVPIVPNRIIENPVSIINEIEEINQRIQEIRLPDVVRRNTDEEGMRAQVKKNNRVGFCVLSEIKFVLIEV